MSGKVELLKPVGGVTAEVPVARRVATRAAEAESRCMAAMEGLLDSL